MKVFISGSISIQKLSVDVKNEINKYISKGYEILVGDAKGIDLLVQKFCKEKDYYNLTVYSIYKKPRSLVSKSFRVRHIKISTNIKSERKKQNKKDEAMTLDSDFSFVIWNGKSKGSYKNILRALKYKKPVKVYLINENIFLYKPKEEQVNSIFKKYNGYTATEVVEILSKEGIPKFKKASDLYQFLVEEKILKPVENIYLPEEKFLNLFIIDKYKGRVSGIKFKEEFLNFLKENLKFSSYTKQHSLF
ncbi:hypothetical protein [Persephonella sp.]